MTDDLALLLTLRRAAAAIFQTTALLISGDLTYQHFAVLRAVRDDPGARPVRICAAVGLKKTHTTGYLAYLAARGLIERRFRSGNETRVHITDKGHFLIAAYDAELEALAHTYWGDLPESTREAALLLARQVLERSA